MLCIGKLLLALRERNFEHLAKCRAAGCAGALRRTYVDVIISGSLEFCGLGSGFFDRNEREGAQAALDAASTYGDPDDPVFGPP